MIRSVGRQVQPGKSFDHLVFFKFLVNKPVKAGVSHWKALFTSSLFDAKLLWSVGSIELLQKKMHFGTAAVKTDFYEVNSLKSHSWELWMCP